MKAPNRRVSLEPAAAPDGGYGWFILLSCFLVFGLTFGVIKAFGFGYALTWTPTVTMVGMYFEKRRPVANALASSGECIFTFVLTPLFQLLIDSFSWRGALLILGGLQLNLCVCGMLLRPLKATRTVTSVSEVTAEEEGLSQKLLQKEDSNEIKPMSEKEKELNTSEGSDQEAAQSFLEDPNEKPNRRTLKNTKLRTKIRQYVDYTLIKNAPFMVYSMFGVFAALGFFAPSLFLVPYARSKGIEEYQAAALMSISAVLDLFGRVFFGWVANLRLVETLVAFSAAHGLVYGATVAIHITVLPEVVGVEKLGSALGFFMLIRSSGGLLGPPIAGFFIDKMDNYGTGFLMSGVALIVSALFLLILHQMNRRARVPVPKSQSMQMDTVDPSLRVEEKEAEMT
ncbi:unnamed protein product [Menidia menidia]|uniref:(Atlantic silverside) hypothetical protein n=1 Tax=Menidia menidia TaxID=238744 RepID=A0A8S4BBE8_9TELE|nr:unnamed protein product [Menidia menidia]